MAENKTKATEASVEEFLQQLEDPVQRLDALEVCSLMEKWSGQVPKMWGSSIVGFGLYHYQYDSGREGEFFRVGFSPRKQNLTLYIMNGFERYPSLMQKLGKHKTGKSCLYIKRLSDINLEVLESLVCESLDYMAKKYGPEL